MKKFISVIIGAVLIAGIVLGAIFGVKACKDKKDNEYTVVTKDYCAVEYFEDIQYKTQPAAIRVWAVGDNPKKITYQIDTQTPVELNSVTDDCTSKWNKYKSAYKKLRYVDSGISTIDLSSLTAGDHVMKVMVHNGDKVDTIYRVIFTLKE